MDKDHIEQMAEAFRQVLSEGAPEGESERVILIKRIPIICNDIIEIKTNIKWNTKLTMAIAGGIGTFTILLLVAILTKVL